MPHFQVWCQILNKNLQKGCFAKIATKKLLNINCYRNILNSTFQGSKRFINQIIESVTIKLQVLFQGEYPLNLIKRKIIHINHCAISLS